MEVVLDHEQLVHLRIMPNIGDPWFLTCVYGSSRCATRAELWSQLIELASSINQGWVVISDFNAYAFQEEKVGGAVANIRSMSQFRNVI